MSWSSRDLMEESGRGKKKSAEHAGLFCGGAEERRESVVEVSRRRIEAYWRRVRASAYFSKGA